jgi:hypothetical protein
MRHTPEAIHHLSRRAESIGSQHHPGDVARKSELGHLLRTARGVRVACAHVADGRPARGMGMRGAPMTLTAVVRLFFDGQRQLER